MKAFKLTLKKFPKALNGHDDIPFTEKALIRAVVAAGQNPLKRAADTDELAHLDGLAALVRSSLDTSGRDLRPTGHFLGLGSTAKGGKSYGIGNALCAHTAYKKFGIPWLLDIEQLPSTISLSFKKGKSRPDYIGKDRQQRWYVFESKGRTSKPGAEDLKKWKKQAKTITTINGIRPVYNIVSASYLNSSEVWEVLWVDPPSADGINFEVSQSDFLESYYRPIYSALKKKRRELDGFTVWPHHQSAKGGSIRRLAR